MGWNTISSTTLIWTTEDKKVSALLILKIRGMLLGFSLGVFAYGLIVLWVRTPPASLRLAILFVAYVALIASHFLKS